MADSDTKKEKVVELDNYRPHIAGEAHCTQCGFSWIAVAPTGTKWVWCDECGSEKGLFTYPVVKEGDHWSCGCGNDLFYITRDAIYCPACGNDQEGFE